MAWSVDGTGRLIHTHNIPLSNSCHPTFYMGVPDLETCVHTTREKLLNLNFPLAIRIEKPVFWEVPNFFSAISQKCKNSNILNFFLEVQNNQCNLLNLRHLYTKYLSPYIYSKNHSYSLHSSHMTQHEVKAITHKKNKMAHSHFAI